MLIRFARIGDERLAAMAPKHWREKAAMMRFRRGRLQELAVGGLLAEMLMESAGAMGSGGSAAAPGALGALRVLTTPDGKPHLQDFPDFHFSLSHSEEIAMCVVADRPVGCDVERRVDLDAEMRREIGSIEAWVLREAAFKCGSGGVKAKLVAAPDGYAAAVAANGI